MKIIVLAVVSLLLVAGCSQGPEPDFALERLSYVDPVVADVPDGFAHDEVRQTWVGRGYRPNLQGVGDNPISASILSAVLVANGDEQVEVVLSQEKGRSARTCVSLVPNGAAQCHDSTDSRMLEAVGLSGSVSIAAVYNLESGEFVSSETNGEIIAAPAYNGVAAFIFSHDQATDIVVDVHSADGQVVQRLSSFPL